MPKYKCRKCKREWEYKGSKKGKLESTLVHCPDPKCHSAKIVDMEGNPVNFFTFTRSLPKETKETAKNGVEIETELKREEKIEEKPKSGFDELDDIEIVLTEKVEDFEKEKVEIPKKEEEKEEKKEEEKKGKEMPSINIKDLEMFKGKMAEKVIVRFSILLAKKTNKGNLIYDYDEAHITVKAMIDFCTLMGIDFTKVHMRYVMAFIIISAALIIFLSKMAGKKEKYSEEKAQKILQAIGS